MRTRAFLGIAAAFFAAATGCGGKTDAASPLGDSGPSGNAGSTGIGGTGGSRPAAIDASPDGQDGAKSVQLELGTWWTGMSEVAALQAVIALHKKTHPDVALVVFSAASQADLESTVRNRLTDGNPPAAFQANVGRDAETWAPFAVSLNASSAAWLPAFKSEVLEQLTDQGRLIGVPLSLSRQNMAYWNLRVLDKLTLAVKIPKTLQELGTWLEQVSVAGYTHPLCFGGKDSWVAAHVVFEAILPAVAGADFSKAYWSGQGDPSDAKMIAVLDFVKGLTQYLSTDWIDMDMAAGIFKLMASETDPARQCLMTTMGDWGGQMLSENGANVPDKDFVGTGWPGASLITVFAGDAFVGSKGEAPEPVLDLFDTLASEAGQIAFCEKRGALPSRLLSVVPDTFDVLTKKNIADLSNPAGTALAGFKVLGKATFPFDALGNVVRDYWQTKDSAALLAFLKDNYASLK